MPTLVRSTIRARCIHPSSTQLASSGPVHGCRRASVAARRAPRARSRNPEAVGPFVGHRRNLDGASIACAHDMATRGTRVQWIGIGAAPMFEGIQTVTVNPDAHVPTEAAPEWLVT